MRLTEMTTDELRLQAGKKNKKGCATKKALEAQEELWRRNHWTSEIEIDDGVIDIDINDIQYNG